MINVFLILLLTQLTEAQKMPDEVYESLQENHEHNEIFGIMEFDPEICNNVQLTRGNLYDILDPYFQEVTGIEIMHDDDHTTDFGFEIEISMELVDEDELKVYDFEELKEKIRDAIPCDNSGIHLHGFHTVFSEVVNYRIDDDETELSDMAETEVGQSVNIPREVSHKNDIGEVRSQGKIGSCVAFSSEALFQFYEKRDNRKTQVFSTKYFYYHRTERLIAQGRGGMNMNGVGDLVSQYGTVPESTFPYKNVQESQGQSAIPSNIKRQGVSYGKNNYADYNFKCIRGERYSFSEFKLLVKSAIAIYGPIILGVSVHRHNGCDMWNSKGKPSSGGHAMVGIGYDEQGIEIRNSWGTRWCSKNQGHVNMNWNDAHQKTSTMCFFEKPSSSNQHLKGFDFKNVVIGSGGNGGRQISTTNPCDSNNGRCDRNASCENNNGRAQCTCKSGYEGSGRMCTRSRGQNNPCDSNNGGCDGNASCENNNGRAQCTCNSGYEGSGSTCTRSSNRISSGGYEKKSATHCARQKMSGRDNSGRSLSEAQRKCDANSGCGGVYDSDCDNSGTFYLCKKGFRPSGSRSSCVYMKKSGGGSSPRQNPTRRPTARPRNGGGSGSSGKCLAKGSCSKTVEKCGHCIHSDQCEGRMYCCPYMKKCVETGSTPCFAPVAECIPPCSERKSGYPGTCGCKNKKFPNLWMSTPSSGGPRVETDIAGTEEVFTKHGANQFVQYFLVFVIGVICAGVFNSVANKFCSSHGEEFESLLVEEI